MSEQLSWGDSHCHLDLTSINSPQKRLAELKAANCTAILIPSTHGAPSQPASHLQQLSAQIDSPHILTSFGYHPWYVNELHTDGADIYPQLLHEVSSLNHLNAIGETGLDHLRATTQQLQTRQLESFSAHCQLASYCKLPVIIHSVKSHAQVLAELKRQPKHITGVIHGFTGSYEQAMHFIDLGFYIGVGGSISYPRANKTRQAISQLPLEALLLETDAPDMPLFKQQGQDNRPENILTIASLLSELKQLDCASVLKTCHHNFQRLFPHA